MTRYLLKPTFWDSSEPGYEAVNAEIKSAWKYVEECDPATCAHLLAMIVTSAFSAGWVANARYEAKRSIAEEIETGLREILEDLKTMPSAKLRPN